MRKEVIQELIESVKQVLPRGRNGIPLHEPYFGGHEWDYVKECIDTRWVSSVGKYVDLFEEKMAELTGVKRAVAVVNGTAALHISLRIAGVEVNDEVLVPALTFVATANAVAYCGAVCHFVDSQAETLGLDPVKLYDYLKDVAYVKDGACYNRRTGRRIKAVVPMHTFGHPVDMQKLQEVCSIYHLEIVEDAAESLGSYYHEKHTGNFGKLATVSFNGNKIVTTGGGGAILTNDEELGKLAKHLTTTAKISHPYLFQHDQLGYNYRMPNINAALGCAQLEQLPRFLQKKRVLAHTYKEKLKDVNGVTFVEEPTGTQSNYWLNAVMLDVASLEERNEVIEAFHHEKIFVRPAWALMHQLTMYQDCPKMDLKCAEEIEKRLINLPSSVSLG